MLLGLPDIFTKKILFLWNDLMSFNSLDRLVGIGNTNNWRTWRALYWLVERNLNLKEKGNDVEIDKMILK